MVKEKTEGITMRSICSASRAPKLSLAQPETAKIVPPIPQNVNKPPNTKPVSNVTHRNARSNRGSSGNRPSVMAKTLVKVAKAMSSKPSCTQANAYNSVCTSKPIPWNTRCPGSNNTQPIKPTSINAIPG